MRRDVNKNAYAYMMTGELRGLLEERLNVQKDERIPDLLKDVKNVTLSDIPT